MNNAILPRWIDIFLLPIINLLAALCVAGIIIALIGENPFTALVVMLKGAFVYHGGLGYTLYYTTYRRTHIGRYYEHKPRTNI